MTDPPRNIFLAVPIASPWRAAPPILTDFPPVGLLAFFLSIAVPLQVGLVDFL